LRSARCGEPVEPRDAKRHVCRKEEAVSEQEKSIRRFLAAWMREGGSSADKFVERGESSGLYALDCVITGLLRDCEVVRAVRAPAGFLWPTGMGYTGAPGVALFIRDKAKVPAVDALLDEAMAQLTKATGALAAMPSDMLTKLQPVADAMAAVRKAAEAIKGGGK
jgi:hypothetical protein